MPELPEVETSCRGIAPHLETQRITQVIIRHSQLRWPIPSNLKIQLLGASIERVYRRGKYILLQTDRGTVILHLGMSGNLRIVGKDTAALKHDHVDIILASGQCLRFHDPRRFGCLLWTKHDPLQHKLLIKLGPEPLSAAFNAKYLFAKTRKKKIAIKQLIMNSQIVVGVGNIYACEALFKAKILPSRAAQNMDYAECKNLVIEIKKNLRAAIKIGGTTLRNFLNSDGQPGYFQQRLYVYGRAKLPCKICQNVLAEIRLSNRSTVFCDQCQR